MADPPARGLAHSDIQFSRARGRGRLVPILTAYDSFNRANSSTLGNLDSGQKWTEDVTDLEINTNVLQRVSGDTNDAMASFPLGRQEGVEIDCRMEVGDVTDCRLGVMFRFFNPENFLMVGFWFAVVARLALVKMEGGSLSTLTTVVPSSAISNADVMRVHAIAQGGVLMADCHLYSSPNTKIASAAVAHPDYWYDFRRGTRAGFFTGNGNADKLNELIIRAW